MVLVGGFTATTSAQFVTVSGTVYDITAKRPLEAVAVQSTSGRGTVTDTAGHYLIVVKPTDSIWFSVIGKSTLKFPVDTISNTDNFNISIHLRATELPEVKVRNNYYRYDSMLNRQEYAKIFNFKKPTLRVTPNANYNPGASIGFDLEEIINMFRFKRNNSIMALQKRLIEQEQEKYVNSRFSKAFVRKITKLQSPDLDSFILRNKPEYTFLQQLNDLELGYWVQKKYEQYKAARLYWKNSINRRREE
jgi:hypothetical protein